MVFKTLKSKFNLACIAVGRYGKYFGRFEILVCVEIANLQNIGCLALVSLSNASVATQKPEFYKTEHAIYSYATGKS